MDVVVHAGSGYSAGQTVGERRDQPAVGVGSNDGSESEGIGGMSGGERFLRRPRIEVVSRGNILVRTRATEASLEQRRDQSACDQLRLERIAAGVAKLVVMR